MNLRDGRPGIVIGWDIFAAAVLAVPGFSWLVLKTKGEQGKRIMTRLEVITLAVVIIVGSIIVGYCLRR